MAGDAGLPLEFITAPAALGEQAEVVTAAGRRLRGTLRQVNPPYAHGFGAPLAELSSIGAEVRALLHGQEQDP